MSKKLTLIDAIIANCQGYYRIKRLGPVAMVRGQAFTYMQKSLRLDGWRGMSYANIVDTALQSPLLGFDRGRGRRVAHGGHMMWGGECDVIWIKASRSDCTDEQMIREEADERAARMY